MKQIAIITGGSRGIGRAIALSFARQNIHSVLLARNAAQLAEVAALISEVGGTCDTWVCDMAKEEDVQHVLGRLTSLWAEPVILINNAGYGGPFVSTDELELAEWDKIFAINVKAPFLLCRQLLPAMKKMNFGRIVNIASVYGTAGGAQSAAYAASKHALVGYTKSLAVEWGEYNITSNIISPGFVDTAMGAVGEAYLTSVIAQIPARRQATTEEIARLVDFLVRPDNGYINGANLMVDGGLSAGFRFV